MVTALEEVREALRADSDYGPAYNVAGLIYAELKEDKLAHENFQRALRIDALDSDANNNYGRFLCERKREAEAIKYFQAALSNPLYVTPERSYVNAGLCTLRQGDVARAEGYFLEALRVRPMQPQALYQLADIAYARGDMARAKDYLMRLEKVASPGPEVLWLVAARGTQARRSQCRSELRRPVAQELPEFERGERAARRTLRMSRTHITNGERLTAGAILAGARKDHEVERPGCGPPAEDHAATGGSAGSGRVRSASRTRVRARLSAKLRHAARRRSAAAPSQHRRRHTQPGPHRDAHTLRDRDAPRSPRTLAALRRARRFRGGRRARRLRVRIQRRGRAERSLADGRTGAG